MAELSASTDIVALPAMGHDPAALALLPLGVASSDDGSTSRDFAYQMQVDGRPRRVVVSLRTASDRLPQHADQLVFLGLLQLAMQDGDPADVLQFQRRALFDLLGWGRGQAYRQLREALERLASVTIVVRSELLARDGRPYQRRDEAAHLIDRYQINNAYDSDCWLAWGHLVKEAFRLGDLKRLDWQLIRALENPVAAQLYRLVDRVVMSGEQRWEVGWRPLAQALGLSTTYARPARFRQVIDPHIEALIAHQVIDDVEYQRGGTFVFHVRNYLRVQLRRVLVELGVYPDAARQLVAGYDETAIMKQVDSLMHGNRPKPQSPGGYLVEAVREGYELRYAADEPEAFAAIWGMLSPAERDAYHQAGLRLCASRDSLFDTQADPTAWSLEQRAVVRFLICHNLDPAEVLRRPDALRAPPSV